MVVVFVVVALNETANWLVGLKFEVGARSESLSNKGLARKLDLTEPSSMPTERNLFASSQVASLSISLSLSLGLMIQFASDAFHLAANKQIGEPLLDEMLFVLSEINLRGCNQTHGALCPFCPST